ncbi:MAG: DUF3604 domain-containing protein [Lentisphaeria bacterium]|nr:DUF3604 domain-containing protein [Lentisphaeria bacterium]
MAIDGSPLNQQTWSDISNDARQREPMHIEARAVPGEAVAGEALHLRLEYTPRGFDLPAGTIICLAPPRFWRKHLGMAFTELHSQFDVNTERHPGGSFAVVKAYPPEGSDLRVEAEMFNAGFHYGLQFALRDAPLRDGETLVVYLGDPAGPKAQVPKTAHNHPIPTLVKLPDRDYFQEVPEPPMVTAHGGPARKLRVRCPAVAPATTQIAARIVAVDDISENSASDYDGELTIWRRGQAPAEGVNVNHTTEKKRSDVTIRTSEERFDFFCALDAGAGISGRSNPVGRPEDFGGYGVYFGDLHCHASPGDAFGTEDEAFTYGKWYSGLDFCAVTHQQNSPNSFITQECWERNIDLAEQYNQSGEFVTLPGCENYIQEAHRIAYFRSSDDARRYKVSRARGPEYDLGDPAKRERPAPEDLWQALQGFEAFTVPHHTRYIAPADWDREFPAMERCVEIWSRWGSNEVGGIHSVQAALMKGHHLGFIGSTDNQFAQPGNGPFGVNRGAACTGVLAEELTRSAIWDAIRARRCYATTGEKMLVNVSLGPAPMGSEVTDYTGPRTFAIVAAGTDRLTRIELLRNNEVLHEIRPGELTFAGDLVDDTPLEQVLLPPAYETRMAFCFYYVRITQADGHMAWTSPIWVNTPDAPTM